MLSVEKCKKILGEKAVGMTDELIEKMRDELYIGANLAFSHWRENRGLISGDIAPTDVSRNEVVSESNTSRPPKSE